MSASGEGAARVSVEGLQREGLGSGAEPWGDFCSPGSQTLRTERPMGAAANYSRSLGNRKGQFHAEMETADEIAVNESELSHACRAWGHGFGIASAPLLPVPERPLPHSPLWLPVARLGGEWGGCEASLGSFSEARPPCIAGGCVWRGQQLPCDTAPV